MDFIKRMIEEIKFFYKEPEIFPGAIKPVDEEMISLDETVATVNQVTWKELDINKIPKYPIYSQNGSGSCVAMSLCLIASILYKIRTGNSVKFSPSYLYKKRSNSPQAGMVGTDAFKIASQGLCLEELMPSMDLTEYGINNVPEFPEYKKVAEVFALEDTFVQLPTKDIETVASVMQTTGKPVMVWFDFIFSEWLSIPIIKKVSDKFLRHSVVAVDYGMYKGEKAVAIQESWGLDSTQFGVTRIIRESFFNARNVFSAYPRRFKFESTGDKAFYDGTIISFQKCMLSIGLFPKNTAFVEKFGPLSKSACVQFQTLQKLSITGIIDEATNQRLKALFK